LSQPRLFGTDGIRGVAGELLDAQLAWAVGEAATALLAHPPAGGADASPGSGNPADVRPQALLIRDTRESGEMLQAALADGIAAAGGSALLGGVLPTPAMPLLMRRYGLDLGVVISASHNPYYDNGIKLFGRDGFKLSDAQEHEIEARVTQSRSQAPGGPDGTPGPGQGAAGAVRALHGAEEDYLRELQLRFAALDLTGVSVLLDCANGATYRVAPEIFGRLGAKVTTLAARPDGRNINAECGSTHLQGLIDGVGAGGHDVGFAFDGDGDRVLAVDGAGRTVDGDELMALVALHMQASGRLKDEGVVVTVMTNYGFHSAMADAGVSVATTDVGDRYVLQELRARSWTLGGEQSGHIIDLSFSPSGDGIASALLALEALDGRSMAEHQVVQRLPQRLVNVPVRNRAALATATSVREAERAANELLSGRGRVLLRPSGTEPLVRVMVEAPTVEEAESVSRSLAQLVEEELA
jgi:phosphoglucosamine mutase